MSKKLTWIIGNGCWSALVYYALIERNFYAVNAAKFIVWFLALIGIGIFFGRNNEGIKKALQNSGVSKKVDFAFDFLITVCFAAAGWFGYAVLYLFHAICLSVARQKV